MPNYYANNIVLIRYPFTESFESKVRPAVVISTPHISKDIFIIPLTSKTDALLPGEFVLEDWNSAGLNVATAALKTSLTSWIEIP